MKYTDKLLVSIVCIAFFAVSVFAENATVVSVSGKVEVQKNSQWVALEKGAVLDTGSLISTGFKSEAVLKIGASSITVKALTRLTIEELTEKDNTLITDMYLEVGGIKADVKAMDNKRVGFTVKSPVATASVRGTAGEISADGTLIGSSGTWAFATNESGRNIPVRAGQTVAVSPDAGGVVTPQENAIASSVVSTPASSIADGESVSDAPPSAATALASAAGISSGSKGQSGTIIITVVVADN